MRKKVAVMMAQGFEPVEVVAPVDAMRRAGLDVTCVSVMPTEPVSGGQDIVLMPDANLEGVDLSSFDALVVPGGSEGVQNLLRCTELLEVLPLYASGEGGRHLASICAGPMVLNKAGVLAGRKVTCYPGCQEGFPEGSYQGVIGVVEDGNLITASGPGQALSLGRAIIKALCGEETAHSVMAGMLVE